MSTRVQIPRKPASRPARSFTPAPFGALQRKCACSGSGSKCESCKKKEATVQRSARGESSPGTVPPIVHAVLRSPGQSLDTATRKFFEPRFGHDFSKVRVHTDARAAESAGAVEAHAYTAGHEMVFGAGRYAPNTAAGRSLLAHELTHVVQQKGQSSSPRVVSSANDSSEREASQSATVATEGKTASVRSSAASVLQRQDAGTDAGGAQGAAAATGEMVPDDPYPSTSDGEQPGLFSLSDEGFEFIKNHEGVKTNLYNDSQGHCTIGVGHLVHQGNCNGSEPENFRKGITEDEALDLFRTDLGTYEAAVSGGVTSRLNQYYFDALVSFTYNVGIGAFQGSGVLKQVNAKNYSKVPGEMLKWVKPPEIKGRRTDEANLFRTGQY